MTKKKVLISIEVAGELKREINKIESHLVMETKRQFIEIIDSMTEPAKKAIPDVIYVITGQSPNDWSKERLTPDDIKYYRSKVAKSVDKDVITVAGACLPFLWGETSILRRVLHILHQRSPEEKGEGVMAVLSQMEINQMLNEHYKNGCMIPESMHGFIEDIVRKNIMAIGAALKSLELCYRRTKEYPDMPIDKILKKEKEC